METAVESSDRPVVTFDYKARGQGLESGMVARAWGWMPGPCGRAKPCLWTDWSIRWCPGRRLTLPPCVVQFGTMVRGPWNPALALQPSLWVWSEEGPSRGTPFLIHTKMPQKPGAALPVGVSIRGHSPRPRLCPWLPPQDTHRCLLGYESET